MMSDWEMDDRPLAACLKAWAAERGMTRQQAAHELRVPLRTYNGWCDGRGTGSEGMARRLMTMIDGAVAS